MLYIFYLMIVLCLAGIDQFSKFLITANFELGQVKTVIAGFFDITYVRNYGAGFSILQNETSFLYMVSFLAIGSLTYLLLTSKKSEKLYRFCYLLIISGSLGNFIDRIRFRYVVDFLDFVIFHYDFPVFNIADCYITVGCFLLILAIFRENKHA